MSTRFEPVRFAVKEPVSQALLRREEEAITFAYFAPYLGDLTKKPAAWGTVRRQISRGFTQNYLHMMDGDIATGIPGLFAFDDLSSRFPRYDLPLLGLIAYWCGAEELRDPVLTTADSFAPLYAARCSVGGAQSSRHGSMAHRCNA